MYVLCVYYVCIMYVLCMYYVCIMYVLCMCYVCVMYVLCMYYVCIMYVCISVKYPRSEKRGKEAVDWTISVDRFFLVKIFKHFWSKHAFDVLNDVSRQRRCPASFPTFEL